MVDQDAQPLVGINTGLYNLQTVVGERLTNLGGIARYENVPYGNWGVYVDAPDSLGIGNSQRQYVGGLAVELGTEHIEVFDLTVCVGTLNVTVRDQDSLPVASYPVQLATYLGAYKYASTNAGGVAVFAKVPCNNYAAIAEPNAGFSVNYSAGSGLQNGLGLTNASTLNTLLRVTRN